MTRGARNGLACDDEAEVGVVEANAWFGDDDAAMTDHVVGVRQAALVAWPIGVAADAEARETGGVLVQLPNRDVFDVPARTRDRSRAPVLVDRAVEVDAMPALSTAASVVSKVLLSDARRNGESAVGRRLVTLSAQRWLPPR